MEIRVEEEAAKYAKKEETAGKTYSVAAGRIYIGRV